MTEHTEGNQNEKPAAPCGQRELALLACPFCGNAPDLMVSYFDDDHKYPRPHWHAKVECGYCEATQGWQVVSAQEADTAENAKVEQVVKEWNQRAS